MTSNRVKLTNAVAAAAVLFLGLASVSAKTIEPESKVTSPLAIEATPPAVPLFALFEHREIRAPLVQNAKAIAEPAIAVATIAPNRAKHSGLRSLLQPLVAAAELRHSLPRGLLDALIMVESAYQPLATSRVGAAGLAQLMPATARTLGVLDRYDIAANVDAGARLLRLHLDEFDSVALALAAYNAGAGAVRRARGIPHNSETPLYVAKVMRAWSRAATAAS